MKPTQAELGWGTRVLFLVSFGLYWVTGSGGVFGGFRCGALGGAGGLGGFSDIDGGVEKPEPFLIRTSPTSVVRLILAPPPPTTRAILLLSPSGMFTG